MRRLLWVENHNQFVRMSGRFLVGYGVTVVPSVAAARTAIESGRFDVILLDHDLDDGPGVTLLDSLRGLVNRPPVVACSAHADGNAALLAAGADAACPKAEFATVGAVLAAVVGRRGSP